MTSGTQRDIVPPTMDLVAVMSTYAVSGFYAIAVSEQPPGEEPLEPLSP